MNASETKRSDRKSPAWALIRVVCYMLLLWCTLQWISEVIRLIDPNLLAPLGSFTICFSELVLTLISVVLAYFFLRKDFPDFLNEINLRSRQAPVEICLGFVFGAILLGIMFGVTWLMGGVVVSKVNWPVNVIPGLALYLVAGFTEEWIFRGFIFNTIEKSLGTIYAVLISSLLFGFAHVVNMPAAATGYIFYACTLLSFEAGLPLSGAYLLRRSIWFPVGIHWAWNFMEGTVFGVSVSGTDPGATILTSKMQGRELLSGGLFGPEASVPFFLIGSAFGIGLIYAAHRTGRWPIKTAIETVPISQRDL